MDIYEILSYAVPALIVIILIIYCGKKLFKWNENKDEPISISVKAKVKDKNIIVKNSNSVTLLDVASDTLKGKIVFQTEDGKELAFTFIGKAYRELLDGDKGILTYQGEKFISFERE